MVSIIHPGDICCPFASQSVCQCYSVRTLHRVLHSNPGDRSPLRHVSLAVSFSLQPNQAFSRLFWVLDTFSRYSDRHSRRIHHPMIYSRTEASNRDGENDVVEPEERETVCCRQLFTLKSSVSVLSCKIPPMIQINYLSSRIYQILILSQERGVFLFFFFSSLLPFLPSS